LMKSVDGGITWLPTALDSDKIGNDYIITAIAAAPDSEMIYVAVEYLYGSYARVWKCPNGAADDPFPLQAIIDSSATDTAVDIYDLEVWSDGSNNWVMAATDIDVLVLQDGLFEPWRDMDLSSSFGSFNDAYVAKFDPNFNTTFLIWALIDNGGDFILTCTGANSPGMWGTVIQDADFNGEAGLTGTDYRVDFEFADGYDSDSPILFAALNEGGSGTTGDGNLFMCEFAYVVDGPAMETDITALLPVNTAMCSVEIASNLIIGGALLDNILLISVNNGDTFDEATKNPTGAGAVRIYLPEGYDPESDTAFVTTRRYANDESALSWSKDGCETWNQIAFIDTTIEEIIDMTWSPDFPGGSYMLLLTRSENPPGYFGDNLSLWRTENGADAAPFWERVFCANDSITMDATGNFYLDEDEDTPTLVEWSLDGSTVMLFGDDGDEVIFKSSDEAQTFNYWRTLPSGMDINDWVVLDGVSFYAATDQGFYGKSAYGPATVSDPTMGDELVSIAVQPGFDPSASAMDTIVVGSDYGDIFVSGNAGQDWGPGDFVGVTWDHDGNPLTAEIPDECDVFVAFDQMDATVIYFATSASTVGTAVVDAIGVDVDDIEDFEDSLGGTATAESFSGIWVAPGSLDVGGNVLYAIGGDDAETDIERDVTAWGRVELDMFSMGMATGIPTQVDGTIDLYGDDSTIDIDGVGIWDFLLVPTSGYFSDWDSLTLSSSTVEAITDNIVAGRVFVDGPVGSGYFDIVFVDNDLSSDFDAGEDITVSIGSALGTTWRADIDEWNVWAMVMGEDVTEVQDTFSDGDTPDVTAHNVAVDSTFPTVVSGTVAIQNPVVGKGTFDVMWDADFGFDNGDLGDSLDDFFDYNIQIIEEEDVVTVSGAAAYLFRILIGEEDNEWETAEIDGAVGLWGT